MRKYWIIIILVSASFITINTSCNKNFLDAKPSTEIVQPTSLDEFQKILDNEEIINRSCALGILAADEYIYSSNATWLSGRTATERNSYIWAKDLYENETSLDWNLPYSAIFYANNVLNGLGNIELNPLNNSQFDNVKGSALFVRAFAYYELVNNFAPTYDVLTASNDLGVPLRLKPSIDELLQRSSIKETFDRILDDLTQASQLLPTEIIPTNRSRPTKVAVQALFARIYLNMREYEKAELHADTCLQLYNKLIDYNTISKTSNTPFSTKNDELIYAKCGNTSFTAYSAVANTYTQISPQLISLFSANDLRLTLYFVKQSDGTYDMKRGYHGAGLYPFIGLATDEIYLIKAECAARRNDISVAMSYVNKLLSKRWNPNATVPPKLYQDITANNSQEAIDKILLERRKELVWRGLRWDDLKRLNKEGANITLVRSINNQTYSLAPNDSKYVFPIPNNEIVLSGIQQNQR